jgi:hypothetical protein
MNKGSWQNVFSTGQLSRLHNTQNNPKEQKSGEFQQAEKEGNAVVCYTVLTLNH